MQYIFWAVFAEYQLRTIYIFEQYFRKNKHAVAEQGIVVVADVVDTHHTLHILQGINAIENVLNLAYCVLMFFYKYAHTTKRFR